MNDPLEYPPGWDMEGMKKIHPHRITGSVVLPVRLKAAKGICKNRFVKLLVNPPLWMERKSGSI